MITRLRRGPLGSHLDALATTLHQHGYAPDSIRRDVARRRAVWAVARPSRGMPLPRWMRRSSRVISVPYHRLRWAQWPKAAAGLPHLLQFWRQQDLLPPHLATPAQTEATHGSSAMRSTWNTSVGRRPAPARLSADCHSLAGNPVWHRPCAVAHCVRPGTDGRLSARRPPPNTVGDASCPAVAVRSLLRFLVFRGELAPGLEAAVPTLRQWTHAPLPARLTVEEVERVLATWTGESPEVPPQSRHPAASGPPRCPGA